MQSDILVLLQEYSSEFSVDPYLVKAICKAETGWISWRARYEPHWKFFYLTSKYSSHLGITFETELMLQATSWGLMQVMGSVAREIGFDDYLPKLAQPETGLYYGIKKLSLINKKYKEIQDVVSAYNAGAPSPNNFKYVSDVMANYASYKANNGV